MFSRLAWFPTETLFYSMFLSMKKGMWKQLNQDEVRQRNMGTGSTREPGGQCSKHRVERKRGRDREWWWMKEREDEWREQAEPWPPRHAQWFQFRNKLTNFSWHAPWQPHLFQLFYIYFQISDCSKHSSRLKRQLRNSGLDLDPLDNVHTQPALSQIADRRCYIC